MSKAPLLSTPKNLNHFKKPSKQTSYYSKSTKNCENLEGLPLKRPKYSDPIQHSNGLIAQPEGLEKFCRYVDKLETLFNKNPVISNLNDFTTASESVPDENPLLPIEALKNLMNELNNSFPLHENHLKVFEMHGISCEHLRKNKDSPDEIRVEQIKSGKDAGLKVNKYKKGGRLGQFNENLAKVEMGAGLRTWGIPKNLNLIKLSPSLSIKKEMIRSQKQ